jgi:hypothetical protein
MAQDGRSGPEGTARRSFAERLDQRVLFRFSAVTLRALCGLAALAAALAAAAYVWLSVPPADPEEPPPELPPLALPPRSTVSPEEVAREVAVAPRAPAAAQPGTAAASPASSPAAPPPAASRTPLEAELELYRPLAARLGLPFESVVATVCARPWNGTCLEWQQQVVRRGMRDLLRLDVFLEGAPDEAQLALLRLARRLFAQLEATPAGPGDLDALAGPRGLEAFVASFLEPALAIGQGFRRIERATDGAIPAGDRLRLAEDVYPAVIAVVASRAGATPAERRDAVGKTLAALERKEAARGREAAAVSAARAAAIADREARVAREQAARAADQASSAARRQVALAVLLGAVVGAALLGILLALLAIERHLRALRDAWLAPAPAAEPFQDETAIAVPLDPAASLEAQVESYLADPFISGGSPGDPYRDDRPRPPASEGHGPTLEIQLVPEE